MRPLPTHENWSLPMIEYCPPLIFRHPHIATIYPALFRRLSAVRYERERLTTPDDDFLDLDWSLVGSQQLLLALHGLEGSSQSQYIKGMVRIFNDHGWDAVVMNFRSCSGELNRRRRMYHSGETSDLDFILHEITERKTYKEIVLVGFSLGGNVALKYGGEQGRDLLPEVRKIVAVSAPIDLKTCSLQIERRSNYVYIKRFMDELKRKFRQKRHLYPDIDGDRVLRARGFSDFDDAFTAPVHGFASGEDYWLRASSRPLLPRIAVPTLIISAQDDPFLSREAFPFAEAGQYEHLRLIAPRFGGHVGFRQRHPKGYYWSEQQVWGFVGDKKHLNEHE